MYTCPKCGGTGTFALQQCPRCLGRGKLVEDSQGMTVKWGTIDLGRLTGVSARSPSVEMEDITGMNATVKQFTDATGAVSHSGVVKYLIPGDITPGTVEIKWMGANALTWAHIGHTKTLDIAHTSGALVSTYAATLLNYSIDAQVGAVVEGTASFQYQGM